MLPSSHCFKTSLSIGDAFIQARPVVWITDPFCCEEGVHVLLAFLREGNDLQHDCMVGSAHAFLIFFCQGDLFLCLLLVISRRWSEKISYYLLFAKKICDVYAAPSLYKQVFGTEPVIRFSRGFAPPVSSSKKRFSRLGDSDTRFS